MRVLAISFFDPASVVLSHRDLMRAARHDFRLAVVRAYTERQQQADYVCERLVRRVEDVAPGVSKVQAYWEELSPNLEALREFAARADVIQFHPGIGRGDGDWASQEGIAPPIEEEISDVKRRLGLAGYEFYHSVKMYFYHGSRATWANLGAYEDRRAYRRIAASTIDYAHGLDAAYLPPLVDVGDLRAKPRGNDDPLLIAHTPTDRVACSTEEFLKATQGLGIPVRLGEGIPHSDVLRLKAECNAGFDHLRGAFSVNSLENAALGLAPLFALSSRSAWRLTQEGIEEIHPDSVKIVDRRDLTGMLRYLSDSPSATREYQSRARSWWETYFSAEPITKRLVKFYEGL